MIAHQKSTQSSLHESLLYPAAQVYDWGSTLVVSPHPNAEVLGCGGAMALLRQMGYRVHVMFVGDGYPASGEEEVSEDLDICRRMESIGISDEAALFLDLKEGLIPVRGKPGFEEAVRLFLNELESFQPDTILLPFLDQGNQDVQATWQIARHAARESFYPIRMVEYRMWSWSSVSKSAEGERLHPKTWRLDIKEVIDLKIKALNGHQQSKYPFPWRNPEQELLLHQANPWEMYLEYTSDESQV